MGFRVRVWGPPRALALPWVSGKALTWCAVLGLELGVWDLGFGVEGVGFRVWGLGFGV